MRSSAEIASVKLAEAVHEMLESGRINFENADDAPYLWGLIEEILEEKFEMMT